MNATAVPRGGLPAPPTTGRPVITSAHMPRFHSVLFDCDSTLSRLEGIEALAGSHREEITRLTEATMRGDIPLEDVYARRLELVRPTRERVTRLGDQYVDALVPDAREVVSALREVGVDVRIISGGVRQAVLAVARTLGVPDDSVAAVSLRFAADGTYAGFDERSPLARSGGKRVVIERWVPSLGAPVMLVGDGATDLEARDAVDLFVAFAGVVEREAVMAAAEVIVRAPTLAPILALALGDEVPRDPLHRATYERGRALLESHSTRS
jgi:phosphoserine phosphatase